MIKVIVDLFILIEASEGFFPKVFNSLFGNKAEISVDSGLEGYSMETFLSGAPDGMKLSEIPILIGSINSAMSATHFTGLRVMQSKSILDQLRFMGVRVLDIRVRCGV